MSRRLKTWIKKRRMEYAEKKKWERGLAQEMKEIERETYKRERRRIALAQANLRAKAKAQPMGERIVKGAKRVGRIAKPIAQTFAGFTVATGKPYGFYPRKRRSRTLPRRRKRKSRKQRRR